MSVSADRRQSRADSFLHSIRGFNPATRSGSRDTNSVKMSGSKSANNTTAYSLISQNVNATISAASAANAISSPNSITTETSYSITTPSASIVGAAGNSILAASAPLSRLPLVEEVSSTVERESSSADNCTKPMLEKGSNYYESDNETDNDP